MSETSGLGEGFAHERRRRVQYEVLRALLALAAGVSIGYLPFWLGAAVVGGFLGIMVAKLWELSKYRIELRDPKCTYCGATERIGPVPQHEGRKHWYGWMHRTTILWVCVDHFEQHERLMRGSGQN